MTRYIVKILVKGNSNHNPILKTNNCYLVRNGQDYSDSIIIYSNGFEISGERNKKESITSVLENPNNSIREEIISCLLYLYLCKGIKVQVISIAYRWGIKGNDCFIDDALTLNLTKEVENNYIISTAVGAYLFVHQVKKLDSLYMQSIEKLRIILMEYSMALNRNNADAESLLYYFWRTYNSIYGFISDKNYENEKMEDIETLLKQDVDFEKFSKNRLKSRINDIKNINMKRFIKSNKHFKDVNENNIGSKLERVKGKQLMALYCDAFKENQYLIGKNSKKPDPVLLNCLNNNYGKTENDYSELFLFLINKYGYMLRCELFHGEKMPYDLLVEDKSINNDLNLVIGLLKEIIPFSITKIAIYKLAKM